MNDPRTQGDLFPAVPVLDWLPDETLFSLVSRIHALWGASDPGRTASLLFGSRRHGSQHDLPGFLGFFACQTKGLLGEAYQLAAVRTLLSFYRHFMSLERERELADEMAVGQVTHLKFRLGLLTSRFRANHPLKACLACMRRDAEQHGWAYWHLSHQYPGVWCCPEHGELLHESRLKSTGVLRFFWILPSEAELMPLLAPQYRGAVTMAAARLGRLILDLVHHDGVIRIDPAQLHRLYRRQIVQRGWMTNGGRIRWPLLAEAYVDHVRLLRFIPELQALPATSEEAMAQLGRVLRPPRSGAHPLRHLVMINWLYPDAASFMVDYKADSSDTFCATVSDDLKAPLPEDGADSIDHRRERLIAILQSENTSVRAAARAVDIDVVTAMSWAACAGIATHRRPKVLTPAKRMRLVTQLREGADKKVAANSVGVSIQTVTRILFTEVGLHDVWMQARWLRSQSSHRSEWLRVNQELSGCGVRIMRSAGSATYAWLYRNDREWLKAHSPDPVLRSARYLPDEVWQRRDAELSAAAAEAALMLAQEAGRKRILLWQLYQSVPSLKPKLTNLERLPMTRSVIERALAWRAERGALRSSLL